MATCFQKIIYGKYPIACVYLIYIYFYIKTSNLEKKLLRKFDENSRGVARIWEGGAKNFFCQIWKFACRLGSGLGASICYQ